MMDQTQKSENPPLPGYSNISVSVDALITQIRSYDSSKYSRYLEKAVAFTHEAHAGQKRHSGEPYFNHPLAVAQILANMKLDSLTIIAALLHDTIEDTKVTLKKIAREFTDEVAFLVDGVTKLTQIENKSAEIIQAENLRKLIVAIAKDVRVLIIKLADRTHNMRTLHHVKAEARRRKIALETMEIFVPLAERIGMHAIKNELQDLAFQELHPEIRSSIIARLSSLKKNDKELERKIISGLQSLFQKHNFVCEVFGREKSPHSIWAKMKRKDISFEQLSDVMAFRILVDTTTDCYTALGLIHTNYHAVPGSFKDFISTSKKNGYKSIHTVIIGPFQHKIEVQIRTKSMHVVAEIGVAAHSYYKEEENSTDIEKYNWVRELIQILEVAVDPHEVLEDTKLEMYSDQVFCFTPKGKVIALPKGACTIDFAYGVHSDVGNHCVGARVNKRVVPLRTELQNGDQVEILIDLKQKPVASWAKFVVTGKAASEIKKSIREQQKQDSIGMGKVMISQLLKDIDMEFNDATLKPIIEAFNKTTSDEFFCAVGEAHITNSALLKYFSTKNKKAEVIDNFPQIQPDKIQETQSPKTAIKGLLPNMLTLFAQCCHPIPGDAIVGIQQTGKGITVHISNCDILQSYSANPELWIDLSWGKNIHSDKYITAISVSMINKPGSLATLNVELAQRDVNIVNLKVINRSTDFLEIVFDIEVRGLTHLSQILIALRAKACVQNVQRYIQN